MQKFSLLTESRIFNGWDAKSIQNTLSTIPNCKVKFGSIEYLFSIDGGDEIVSWQDIHKGYISQGLGSGNEKLDEDIMYSPKFYFTLSFGNVKSEYYYSKNGVQTKVWCGRMISMDYILSTYKSIGESIEPLKEDFYIFIDMEDSSFGTEKLSNGKICIELIMKDQFDRTTIIS